MRKNISNRKNLEGAKHKICDISFHKYKPNILKFKQIYIFFENLFKFIQNINDYVTAL